MHTMPITSQHRNCPFKGTPTFIFWNSGGFTIAKSIEFEKIIHEHDIDAFGIVEAGAITDETRTDRWTTEGYNMYYLPRAQKKKGSGMIIGVKKDFTATFKILHRITPENEDKIEIVQLEVWKLDSKTKFFIIYNENNNIPNFIENLDIDSKTIFVGDFNAPNEQWNYEKTNAVGSFVDDFISSHPILLLNNATCKTTYIHYNGTCSRPDLVLAHINLINKLKQENIASPSGNDHSIIKISNLKVRKDSKKCYNTWNFKKANWEDYKEKTEKLVSEDLVDENVHNSNNRIIKILVQCAKEFIPRGKQKNYKPFWSKSLESIKQRRDQARKRAEESNKAEDVIKLNEVQAQLKDQILEEKNTTFFKFISTIDYRKDAKKAHNFVSKLCGKSAGKSDKNEPLIYKNKKITNDRRKAEIICNFLAKISRYNRNEIHKIKPKKIQYNPSNISVYNSPFKLEELEFALFKLNEGKSPGIDKIHPEFLKKLGANGKKTLLKLYNLTLKNTIPDGWKKAEIKPLLKKGKDPSKVDSYRPIALTSALAKVGEHMINTRLTSYLENNEMLAPEQAGFRPHRGTGDQAAFFVQKAKEGFKRKESTLAVFVDFKMAFDKVRRDILEEKMKTMFTPLHLIRWIHNMLSQRFIRVKYNNQISKFKKTDLGVPQGTVTSPVLFNILINDLPATLKQEANVEVRMFADDVVVWTTGKKPEVLEATMNRVLKLLHNWTEINGLIVNTEKTNYEYYTRTHKKRDFQLKYNDVNINHSINPTYLGTIIDQKLTGQAHMKYSADKAKKRLLLMKRIAGVKWGANTNTLATSYKSYVRPVLDHSAEIFITATHSNSRQADIVQNQALRIITGGVKTTPIAAMEMHAKIEPLQARREKAAMILSEKLIRMDEPNWTKHQSNISPVTFIEKTNELKEKYIAPYLNIPRENILPKNLCNNLIQVKIKLSIDGLNNHKSKFKSEDRRHLTEKHMRKNYPLDQWFYIYTDGSALPNGNAGAGIYSNLFEESAPAGKFGSTFRGEMVAIHMALERIKTIQDKKKIVILSDSQAAIQALNSSNTQDSTAFQSRQRYHELNGAGYDITIQWIPAHCNIIGNDKADFLAKMGSKKEQEKHSISFETIKSQIKNTVKNNVQEGWDQQATGKDWNNVSQEEYRNMSRQTAVASFRLDTGHDLLGKHLHRFGIVDSEVCMLCKLNSQDRQHLFKCSELKKDLESLPEDMTKVEKESFLYWLARKRMAE